MKNTMDELHGKILRKFHTLCTVAGLSQDEKQAIISAYGVGSSADIDTHDLIDICNSLSRQIDDKKGSEMDKLRKGVIAAIGGYLRAAHKQSNIEIIKSIACRAVEHDNFNKIPAERLRNLYYTFRNKQKDITAVDTLVANMTLQNMMQQPTSGLLN